MRMYTDPLHGVYTCGLRHPSGQIAYSQVPVKVLGESEKCYRVKLPMAVRGSCEKTVHRGSVRLKREVDCSEEWRNR